jgi:hypothetical protein
MRSGRSGMRSGRSRGPAGRSERESRVQVHGQAAARPADDHEQPQRGRADNTLTSIDPELVVPQDFYAALWIGALLAINAAIGALPADLDELAAQFFAQFRPVAKA